MDDEQEWRDLVVSDFKFIVEQLEVHRKTIIFLLFMQVVYLIGIGIFLFKK